MFRFRIGLDNVAAHNLIRVCQITQKRIIVEVKMARSGYAKGKNAGHVTEQLERKEKPSRTKGVRFLLFLFLVENWRTAKQIRGWWPLHGHSHWQA